MKEKCVDCGKPTEDMSMHGDGRWRCIPCKLKALGRAPRQMTEGEVRARFLEYVWHTIRYWFESTRNPGTLDKMEGLAFSMLTMLDGGRMGLPSFIVAPASHPDDPEYSKEHGEDWYPTNEDSEVDCDIAGGLHDEFQKHQPKDWPKAQEPPPKHPITDMTAVLSMTHLDMMQTVMNGLREAAHGLSKVRPSLFAFLKEAKQPCFKGEFGDTTMRVAKLTHTVVIGLFRKERHFVLQDFWNNDKIGVPYSIVGLDGSANDARFMVWEVEKNWDPDKLKADPESEKDLLKFRRQ